MFKVKEKLRRLVDRLVTGALNRTNITGRLDNFQGRLDHLQKQQDESLIPWLRNMEKQTNEALMPWLHNLQRDVDQVIHPEQEEMRKQLEEIKKKQAETILPWLNNLEHLHHKSVVPWLQNIEKQINESILPWLNNLEHLHHESVVPWLTRIQHSLDDTKLQLAVLSDTQAKIDTLNGFINELREEIIVKKIQAEKSVFSGLSYRAFEDKMRGDTSVIRKRLEQYDPVIRRVLKNNAKGDVFALDLGCGRGEFMDMLAKEYKVNVMGVDADESMAKACQEKQLVAVQCDIYDYLKNMETDSVDLISLIQVAEHIPVKNLFEIMKEIRRVLRAGGACIIETPNPENLIVGACNFYADPSHINVLPPPLLDLLTKSAGFDETEVMRMHWYHAVATEYLDSDDGVQAPIKQVAHFLNNCADFAVIGYLAK